MIAPPPLPASAVPVANQIVVGLPAPPRAVRPPTVTGTPLDGLTLRVTPGSWTGARRFAYGWRRCEPAGLVCGAIRRARGATYTPLRSDTGYTIEAVVTATGPGGSTRALSPITPQVTDGPKPSTASISTTGVLRGVASITMYWSDGLTVGGRPFHEGEPQSSYDFLASRGIKLVRLPIMWGAIQPRLRGPLDPGWLSLLHAEVARIEAAHMAVVRDLLGSCHHPTPDSHAACGDGISQADLDDVWARLSQEFADDRGVVAYDIQNEPNGISPTTWHAFSQSVVDAIRTRGDGKLLWIESTHYSDPARWVSDNPAPWISDPSQNVMYSAHEYFDGCGCYQHGFAYGTYGATEDRALGELATFTGWLGRFHVRGSIGEVGWPNSRETPTWPQWNTLGERWYRAADDAGLWVTYWDATSATNEENGAYDAPQNGWNPLPGISRAESQAQVIEAHPSR